MSPLGRPPTISEALAWATAHLTTGGMESPRLDARQLLRNVNGFSMEKILAHPETALTDDQWRQYRVAVERRSRREPLQYITGEVEFCGRRFAVDRRVLIPRPETEILAEAAVGFFRSRYGQGHLTIGDLGTGSGVLAVTCALELPRAVIHAVDISGEALAVARENAARHGVAGRIHFHQGDLLEPLQTSVCADKLQGIVSNPPYLADAELPGLMPEVRDYEPLLALTAGEDGFGALGRIIAAAPACVGTGGGLFLEIGLGQAPEVRSMLQRSQSFVNIEEVPDLAGIPRVIKAERGG